MKAPLYLISACLCGQPCRYDGQTHTDIFFEDLLHRGLAIAFCPEVAGGLPIPRLSCERIAQRVIDQQGTDHTEAFVHGAEQALALARQYGIQVAILKERSPSCGSTQIYDGTFSGERVDGMGITAQLLKENGIIVYSEENVPKARLTLS